MSAIDLLIIGGGINGAGIAADAAGRGLSVHLCEQHDLASGTSSKSSKLIHGGLRYLEHYEFRLVHEALIEREVLLRSAPHLIKPLDFVLPYHPGLRSPWLIRLGLFLYDHLGRRSVLPHSKSLNLSTSPLGAPLQSRYTLGFTYPDCCVDDARLVIANAMAAREHGAEISPYCKVVKLLRQQDHWQAQVINQINQQTFFIKARAIVNATGPWIEEFFTDIVHLPSSHPLRKVKGSHILVPALYEGSQAYILQQTDGRVVFTIPYADHLTLIGTTDVDYEGDPNAADITAAEIDYLCSVVNEYFKRAIAPTDIIKTFSGVRALLDHHASDAQSLSRDYTLEVIDREGRTPLLSIFGGKLTTYRKLAEQALAKLKPYFPQMGRAWTADARLPGGEFAQADFAQFCQQFYADYAHLPPELLSRYARHYGNRVYTLLAGVQTLADLGQHWGGTCYQREIEYLRAHEWLSNMDDMLLRRTSLDLELTPQEKQRLRQGWESH
ncbi:MAG TPA: glycerol-3-phosphate dehydrogenase [Gammaproteobacteria bacterium]|nr:glycerol-3-phosphate dehydrogenase [Gammaproteobacteria bacterium]